MRVADPKPRICIRVVDSGIGMTDDVRGRAIEPFWMRVAARRLFKCTEPSSNVEFNAMASSGLH